MLKQEKVKQDIKYKSEFEFTLDRPITYQGDSSDIQVNSLILKAPNNRQEDIVDSLGSIFASSLAGMSKLVEAKENPENDKTAKAIEAKAIMLSLKVTGKLKEAKVLFKKLMIDGCCIIAKKEALTEWHLAQISCVPPCDDLSRMMRAYMENFLIQSLIEVLT